MLSACALTSSCSGSSAPTLPPETELAFSFDKAAAWADMQAIVDFGPRPVGSSALEELRQWFEVELTDLGLAPVREDFQDETPLGLKSFANIYADLVADELAPWIIIGAHFDTCLEPAGFVGANDGGSGPAVLLEVARNLVEAEGTRPVNYRFLFIDGEEALEDWHMEGFEDHTYGSRHHVAQLQADPALFERIGMFLLLDLVGDAKLQLLREQHSTRALVDLVFDVARENGLGAFVGGNSKKINDDHQEFLAAGIPSIDLIDFNYGPQNGYWHELHDTMDKCSADSLEITGRIVLHALPRLESWVIASKRPSDG